MKEATYNGSPLFDAIVEDGVDGLLEISLVKNPAIGLKFVRFSEAKPKEIKFSVQEDKEDGKMNIVTGCILLADTPIKQYDEFGNVIYIQFSPDMIRKLIDDYQESSKQSNVDTEHSHKKVKGVFLNEVIQIQASRGIIVDKDLYGDVTDGSAFGSMKVNNPEIMKQIDEGTFEGFSIFGTIKTKQVLMSLPKEGRLTFLEQWVEVMNEGR